MFLRFITGGDLKRARLSVNRTTEEVAKKVGVTRATVERWEKEESQPKVNQAFEILVYCRVDIQPLLKQLEALKELFSAYRYIYDDINLPNATRASKRKNHLNDNQLIADTDNKELIHANEDTDNPGT